MERRFPAGVQYLDVQVTPLHDGDSRAGTWLGASIIFDDVTQRLQVREELVRSNQEVETAYLMFLSGTDGPRTCGACARTKSRDGLF